MTDKETRPYISWELVGNFMVDAFQAAGLPKEDAEICADVLMESDRRGIESHGVNRFKPIYLDRINAGILNPVTNYEIVKETPTTIVADAHDGMGMVASYKMMTSLIEKAKIYGIGPWFDENVAPDWMSTRQKLMSLLQDEDSLNEIVKMVGMDALSPQDRLKMEAARSIREDFLHQNSFDEIDTYTSLGKQYNMMKLVYAFYDLGTKALNQGANINDIVKMETRERIGRYKYTVEAKVEEEYKKISDELAAEFASVISKEDR